MKTLIVVMRWKRKEEIRSVLFTTYLALSTSLTPGF